MRERANRMDRLGRVRIARFTTGDDPAYGVVSGDLDEYGQPAEDSVVVELAGDPLYAGVQPTQTEHRLSDVRLLAPVIPRSKVVGIGRNYAAHAAELGQRRARGAADVPQAEHLGGRPGRPGLLPAAERARATTRASSRSSSAGSAATSRPSRPPT